MWEKQKDALRFAKDRGENGSCAFMEMGTGKSAVYIRFVQWLIKRRDCRLFLIVAPLSVMYVWVDQWDQWADFPILFIDLNLSRSSGIRTARKLAKQGYPVICFVNYESAQMIGRKRVEKTIKGRTRKVLRPTKDGCLDDYAWDMVLLDESTAIKTPGAKMSMFFRNRMRDKSRYRAVLTGSAYTKRLADLWAQVAFATGTEIFPKTFQGFKNIYCLMDPFIPQRIVSYQNVKRLTRLLSRVAILLKKADVVELPPVTHTRRYIDLPVKSRKLYDTITDDMIADLEEIERGGGTVTASHIFAVRTKQHQICSGYIKPDSPDDDPALKMAPIRVPNDKIKELLSILDNRDRPTLVVVQWNEEEKIVCEAIEKHIGFTPKVLNGSVKGAQVRSEMIKAASNDPVFVVKESVGSKGVDMRAWDMTIFYSHRAHTEDYEQMLARNHRGGQTQKITYVHLLCRNTVDMKTMRILEGDLDLAKEVERNWRAVLREAA